MHTLTVIVVQTFHNKARFLPLSDVVIHQWMKGLNRKGPDLVLSPLVLLKVNETNLCKRELID